MEVGGKGGGTVSLQERKRLISNELSFFPESSSPDCRQTRKLVQSVLIYSIISSFVRVFPSFQLSHISLFQCKKGL